MCTRTDILQKLDEWLQPGNFQDYCPNGLQVEGSEQVRTLVTGVTASAALIDAAIAAGADMILVHHGYFWKGEDPCIRGMKKARLTRLLAHDINLVAYHLPLDEHPEYGNNCQLGQVLGLENIRPLSGLVWQGELPEPMTPGAPGGAPGLLSGAAAAARRRRSGIGDTGRLVYRRRPGLY